MKEILDKFAIELDSCLTGSITQTTQKLYEFSKKYPYEILAKAYRDLLTAKGSNYKSYCFNIFRKITGKDKSEYLPNTYETLEKNLQQLTKNQLLEEDAMNQANKEARKLIRDSLNFDYDYVTSDEQLLTAIDKLVNSEVDLDGCHVLAIDTETTGLNHYENHIRLIQIAAPKTPVQVIDLYKINDVEPLKKFFRENTWIKIFHNCKFDLKMLWAEGFEIKGNIYDTLLASKLIFPRSVKKYYGYKHSLKVVIDRYYKTEISKEEQKSDWSGELTENQLIYAAKDVAYLLGLRLLTSIDLVKLPLADIEHEQPYLNSRWQLEKKLLPIIAKMEYNGIRIDLEALEELGNQLEKEKDELENRIQNYYDHIEPFLLTSPAQVKNAIQLMPLNLEGTKYNKITDITSTGFAALACLAEKNEIIDLLLKHRKLSKLISSYTQGLPKKVNKVTGRIHASFDAVGTDTGRFSSSNPNMQNIPGKAEFRGLFVPEKGNSFIVADYSQIQLRIIAQLTKDPAMMKAYKEDIDLHIMTATFITGKEPHEIDKSERKRAKPANFGLSFGSTIKGFKEYAENKFGMRFSWEEVTEIYLAFFSGYKGIARWHEEIKELIDLGNVAMKRRAAEDILENKKMKDAISTLKKLDWDYKQYTSKEQQLLGHSQKEKDRKVYDSLCTLIAFNDEPYLPLKTLGGTLIRELTRDNWRANIALNTPVQATEAELLKYALILLDEHEELQKLGLKILGVVHDEVIFEVPTNNAERARDIVQEIMEYAGNYYLNLDGDGVPCKVDAAIGDSWADKV